MKKQDKRLTELCGKLLLGDISSMTQRELFETVLLFCNRGTDLFTCEKYISMYGTYTEFLMAEPGDDHSGENIILSGLCKLITESAKLICLGACEDSAEAADFEERVSEYCRKDSDERIAVLCRRLAIMHYDCCSEIFRAAFLDGNSRMIWYDDIARGSFGDTYIDLTALMRTAIVKGAKGLIVAHNHPDGDLYPSVADVRITERLRLSCENVGIRFIDHIIVCSGHYRSVCNPENRSPETNQDRKFPRQIGQTGVYRIDSADPPDGTDDDYFYGRSSEIFFDTDDPVSKWDDAGMFESDDEESSGN